jgi:hypothetical protein
MWAQLGLHGQGGKGEPFSFERRKKLRCMHRSFLCRVGCPHSHNGVFAPKVFPPFGDRSGFLRTGAAT